MKAGLPRAFTLVEVVAALAVLATATVLVGTALNAASRSMAAATDTAKAAQVVDPVLIELARLRDSVELGSQPDRLAALAARLPEAHEPVALRFNVARDGTRAVAEPEPGRPALAPNSDARYFLVEVRRQSGSLQFSPGAGFLAITLRVSWPGSPADGAGRGTAVSFNAALSP